MRNSLADTGRIRSAATTTELYRSCMQLSEEARSLRSENEGLKRLGLNAQVLAAHTGREGGALEAVVSEIGHLSGSLREVLERLADSAKVLSDASIRTLHLSHLRSSYLLGRAAGIAEGSAALYERTTAAVVGLRHKLLSELSAGLDEVESLVQELSRISSQIPPATTMIRIVATEIAVRREALMGTVDDLRSFHGSLEAKVERMNAIRTQGVERIAQLGREVG